MINPLISIIIPNYNHALFLEKRIESILKQSYQNYEVIILDDCSTDNSAKIINSYKGHPRVSHIEINKTNCGSPFKQWFKGIRLSKGEWIWIAESDDYADERFIEKLIEVAKDNMSFVYCRSNIIDENGRKITDTTEWLQDLSKDHWHKDFVRNGYEEFIEFLAYKNSVSNVSSALLNKKHLDKLRYSIESFKTCGDWLFFAQLCVKSKIAYVSEPLNYWRNHQKSTRNFHSLDFEHIRMSEITKVIHIFEKMDQGRNVRLDFKKYTWLVDWWLSRASYINVLKRKYINAPLHSKLILSFYFRLIIRLFKQIINSVISKTKK